MLKHYYKVSTMFENSFTTSTTTTTSAAAAGSTTTTTTTPSQPPSPASPAEPEKPGSESATTISSCKKRRKQSNPTRYGNAKKVKNNSDVPDEDDQAAVSGDGGSLSDETAVSHREEEDESDDEAEDEDEDEVSSRPDLQYLCPHCPASFSSDDLIKAHIEEEHVIQLLERQFRQYQFGRNGSSVHNGSAPTADHQELAEHHLSVLMGQRSLRPGSRTSSRSSSLSQPDSPTGRHHRHNSDRGSLPRNECMERDFGNMLPFPMTGGIPALATGPDGKPIPMGMFPPFLFPVMPATSGSSGGSVNGSGPSSGGQNRSSAGSIPTGSGSFCIFNPEAYCELCNKEFCNKYFLKTHKANKHGIYTGDPPTSSSCPVNASPNNNNIVNNGNSASSGPSSIASPGPPAASTGSSGTGSGLQAQAAVSAAAAAASAFFPAGLVSQPPADGQLSQHQVTASTGMGSRMSGPVNPESFCEICQKAFCNKYFLKKHKHKIHGIHSDNSSAHQQTSQSQDSLSSSPGRPADHPKCQSPITHSPSSAVTAAIMQQQQQQHPTNGKGGENGIDPYCGIGLKDFCNKYFSKDRKHKLQQEMFDIQTVVNSIQKAACGQQLDNNSSSISPLKRPLSDLSRSPTPNQSVVAPVAVTNPANSPKNYCNICNKELCNKYFMKTHMLKMHGINIDEQPGEAAQASTIGGVTCDICQKELCSKYFLKVHKQNTHGIYEESSGKEGRGGSRSAAVTEALGITTVATELANEKENSAIAARGIDPKDTNNRYFSHYTEVCPLCQRRFKSIKWLKTHVLNDHSDLQSVRSHSDHPNKQQQQQQHPVHALHEMNPEAALSLVVSPKSHCNSQQRNESPASSPHAGPSLPPDFACLNWLRSHIPNTSDHVPHPVQHESHCESVGEGVRGVGVKRERASPPGAQSSSSSSLSHRRQSHADSEISRKRDTMSSPSSIPAMSPQFAIPQKPVAGGSFFMQAFNISEPEEGDSSRPANFVPSLVYLPVARQVKHPVVVAFQLTPA